MTTNDPFDPLIALEDALRDELARGVIGWEDVAEVWRHRLSRVGKPLGARNGLQGGPHRKLLLHSELWGGQDRSFWL